MPALKHAVTLAQAFAVIKDPGIRNVLLAGPPGVGKTTFGFAVADLLKQPPYKIQYHAEISPPELIGYYVPDGDKFRWEQGPVDLAYTNNGILIHDEIVLASGPAKTFLLGVLDSGRGGQVTSVGKTFTPGPKLKNIATMNGWPYEGAIDDALLDRMDAVFIITAPGPKQLDLLEPDLRELCEDAYASAKDPMLGPKITFRMLMSLQKLRKLLSLDQAILSACHGNLTLAGSLLKVLAMNTTVDEINHTEDDN